MRASLERVCCAICLAAAATAGAREPDTDARFAASGHAHVVASSGDDRFVLTAEARRIEAPARGQRRFALASPAALGECASTGDALFVDGFESQ